ncbi:hypothetical protein MN116_001645 [Schistosoma mekongi]|uniref:Uncharacterized protein n=1 Tax=Schistosoma mekongi TaxID=38744 RepID=A0AAE1ZI86_SCHME|nr:hypothetical protein MN116_001645 [Schistosoma mekongi]
MIFDTFSGAALGKFLGQLHFVFSKYQLFMSKLVRRIINTPKAPKAIGPYNQGIAVNNTLYVSGQLGLVPETMLFAGDDVESQAYQSLKNVREIVQAAGFSMLDIVKTTVLLADMNDFGIVNKIYEQYFTDPYPARVAYQVACLPKTDENTLWLELIPCPIISQSDKSIESSTISSSVHIRIYKTLSNAKTTGSSHLNPFLDVLSGFDNTGNVYLWSSEILLAHSMFYDYLYPGLWNEIHQNFNDHPIKNICELCAGMTGVAGLAISLRKYSNIFKTSYVLITDGNERCVASISSIVNRHSKYLLENSNQRFSIHMDVRNIRWPEDLSQSPSATLSSSSLSAQLDESLIHRFDLIIAADCFFDQMYHRSMLNTIHKLLSLQSGSTFLAISPLRGNSLQNFINLAYQSEKTYHWTVKLLSPTNYLSSQMISYFITEESNRVQFTDNELDKYIGHLVIFTRKSCNVLWCC